MSKDALNELSQKLSDELNKYTHFLMAAAGAAMALALENMDGKPLQDSTWLLVLSIGTWATSFGFGIRHLNVHRNHIIENANCLRENVSLQVMHDRLSPLDKSAKFISHCQFAFLLGGALFYFWWRLWESALAASA